MSGKGWHGIRFAIEGKIDKKRQNSNLVVLVRGYKPTKLSEMAQRIYSQLGPKDKMLADRHTEAAFGYVDLYWHIGERHLLDHFEKPWAFQVSWRNLFVREAHANWLERERLNGKNRPIPADWTLEPVPEEPVPTREDAHEDSEPRGPFDFLPRGGIDFTDAGQYTVGPDRSRLLFEFDPLLRADLHAKCAMRHRPGLYMFVTDVGGAKEVVKIGMFGNGNLSSACSTMGKYCGRFSDTDITSEKWDSRLGPAQGIAKTLTDAAAAGTRAKCHWYICMLPKVVAERKLHLEGDVQMSAQSFENGCVQAYSRAHGGKVPRYNVKEGGQR